MIVKNEAHQLAEALEDFSLFADEIVIVDTGSTDGTRSIAERYTSRVFDFPWCDDFSAARNASFSKARGDYILWLDADDRVDQENREKIKRLKNYFDGKSAFYFIVQGKDPAGLSSSLFQLRCLPNIDEIRFQGRVHERIDQAARKFGLELGTTDIAIGHEGYLDREMVERKVRRNLALLEKEREEGRNDEHIWFYLALSYDHLGLEVQAAQAMEKALAHMEREQRERTLQMQKNTDFLPFIMEAGLFLARIYAKTGESASSLRHLIKANALAERNAEDSQSFFRLGGLFQHIHRHELALSCYMKAIAGKSQTGYFPSPAPPPEREILVDMAYSFMSLNKRDAALGCIQRAWELGLEPCLGWEQLGLSALREGALKLSLEFYESALHTGNLSADGFCNLALLYDKQGMSAKAIQCYSEAMRKDPKHQSAVANLAHLYLRLEKLQHAKTLFEQLLGSGSDDIDILLALARIYAVLREWGELGKIRLLMTKAPGFFCPSPSLAPGLFFSRAAQELESRKKTNLAQWAREIARLVVQE